MKLMKLEWWLQVILWIALCVLVVSLFEERAHHPSYRCIVTVHDQVLCFEGGNRRGRMFRPERRFSRFTLENGEK